MVFGLPLPICVLNPSIAKVNNLNFHILKLCLATATHNFKSDTRISGIITGVRATTWHDLKCQITISERGMRDPHLPSGSALICLLLKKMNCVRMVFSMKNLLAIAERCPV